jgi:hypothetical protein
MVKSYYSSGSLSFITPELWFFFSLCERLSEYRQSCAYCCTLLTTGGFGSVAGTVNRRGAASTSRLRGSDPTSDTATPGTAAA